MKTSEFVSRIVERFGFSPTTDQQAALQTFARFLADRSPNVVMLLCGSAGTGKTSLAAAMVDTLHALGQKLVLMAPTGRAAKVFSMNSRLPAYTIHRTIYREQTAAAADGKFSINFNRYHNALFVVDEASMISSTSTEGNFGSGSLLDDLMQYVYSSGDCRMMLIGDKAQLPPVGEQESPALIPDVLAAYGMRVYQSSLNEVLRQGEDSGILHNATAIRSLITHDALTQLPLIRFTGFADIVVMPGNELIESLASSYSNVGEDDTLVVTRSNKRANIYNQGIRSRILDREEQLCGGDMLMVVKNKYSNIATSTPHEALRERRPGEESNDMPAFLANGDRCVVRRVRHFQELYGFHFAEAQLRFPDLDDMEIETTIVLDTLTSEAPSLTREQNEALYNNVMQDYQDLPYKSDRIKAVREDKYYNALQMKFAYAVTCHKAQGGQWRHVYVDQGYMTDDMLTPDYIHWLYTAFTRATDKLFLVNWPKTQVEEQSRNTIKTT